MFASFFSEKVSRKATVTRIRLLHETPASFWSNAAEQFLVTRNLFSYGFLGSISGLVVTSNVVLKGQETGKMEDGG